eukprot:363688-Chlamydomonas_euryale.AAC.5
MGFVNHGCAQSVVARELLSSRGSLRLLPHGAPRHGQCHIECNVILEHQHWRSKINSLDAAPLIVQFVTGLKTIRPATATLRVNLCRRAVVAFDCRSCRPQLVWTALSTLPRAPHGWQPNRTCVI